MIDQAVLLPETARPVLALILASVIIMGSPGPSTISATAVGAAFGFRRSLRYVGGLILGAIAVLCVVAMGVVAILLSAPWAASALTVVSAVYILYLAFRIATAPPFTSQSRDRPAPAFAGGFVLAIANPKAYLAMAAVFAGSTLFAEDHARDAIAKTAVLSVMIVIIHLFWLSAGAWLSQMLHDPVRSRVVNVALATSLVVIAGLALVRLGH
jgi:threonine/homoserine/homoserine lactone efflux protein